MHLNDFLVQQSLDAFAHQASPQGFLRASRPMSLENVLGQVMGELHQMHPRNQLPAVSQVPEDAIVNLVRLKYYGESNAANFAAMYWHAQNDHVQYFAMARHAVPLGHGFTAAGFLHPNEVPKWGVYDGCGLPCQDDDERWCGCSNEAARGFPNRACAEGEKRFAVYKIGVQNTSAASAETSANTSSDATDATAKTANASQPASGLDSGFSDTQCFLAASVFRTAWTGCTAFSLLEALRGRR
eukprot:symbB.v1.2.033131.t1/scaffold4075.1/size45108/3